MSFGLMPLTDIWDPSGLLFGGGNGPPDYTAADLLAQHERQIARDNMRSEALTAARDYAEQQRAAAALAAGGTAPAPCVCNGVCNSCQGRSFPWLPLAIGGLVLYFAFSD